jgi:hypothetical protein
MNSLTGRISIPHRSLSRGIILYTGRDRRYHHCGLLAENMGCTTSSSKPKLVVLRILYCGARHGGDGNHMTFLNSLPAFRNCRVSVSSHGGSGDVRINGSLTIVSIYITLRKTHLTLFFRYGRPAETGHCEQAEKVDRVRRLQSNIHT